MIDSQGKKEKKAAKTVGECLEINASWGKKDFG